MAELLRKINEDLKNTEEENIINKKALIRHNSIILTI